MKDSHEIAALKATKDGLDATLASLTAQYEYVNYFQSEVLHLYNSDAVDAL